MSDTDHSFHHRRVTGGRIFNKGMNLFEEMAYPNLSY
jgi:hypothetical protein